MKSSIVNIGKKRGRGRPKTGAIPVLVRFTPEQAVRLDAWRKNGSDRLGRPEAIRRLVELALNRTSPPKGKKGRDIAAAASRLAGHGVDQITDETQPREEQRRRKSALIRGPRDSGKRARISRARKNEP